MKSQITGQTAVTFRNRQGLTLFGVLEEPTEARSSDIAVLLVSAGVKMRVGPQGLYRRISRDFVALGLPVLRFDFYGLGDSEGELPETLLKDVYNHIEVGRFIDDTIDAMDWMQRTHGTKRFVLVGLCGGAVTALLAAERDPRVTGLLGIGVTTVLSSRSVDASRYMTEGQVQDWGRIYARRVLNPRAWYRLLTFQADNRLIRRVIVQTFRRYILGQRPVPPAAAPVEDNANPRFPPAFFRMLSTRRPMLLVYGGSDRLLWEFEEKFVARHRATLDAMPRFFEVHVIADANHVLSTSEWQNELLDVARPWLRRHFSSDVEGDVAMALRMSADAS